MTNEIVICAAIKIKGQIFRGNRHNDCFLSARQRFGDELKVLRDEQGFITSTGRYVDREEGYQLQINAGIQSAQGSYVHPGTLFSEDLY